MFVSTVVCISMPRFELLTAVGTRKNLLREAVALAPEPDRDQVVGEVSGAAEAVGVHAGMRLGEALARCPDLRLVAADPDGAASAWGAVLGALEGIGAAVESRRSRSATSPTASAVLACTRASLRLASTRRSSREGFTSA